MRKSIRILGRVLGESLISRRTSAIISGLALLGLFPTPRVRAQVSCSTCPPEAVTCVAGPGFLITRTNGTPINPDSSDPVGVCEQVIIKTDLAYRPIVGGQVGAGYYGGQARVLAYPGPVASGTAESTNDVTPAGFDTIKIGPAPCGDTLDKAMKDLLYTLTPADIAAGAVTFRFVYSGGVALISPCTFSVSSTIEFNVFIAAPPACAIAPQSSNVWAGAAASFTATGNGPGSGQAGGVPGGGWTFTWTGPGGFARTNTGALSSTITISNATAANAGTYVATISDRFGCKGTASATLAIAQAPPVLSIVKSTNVILTVIGPTGRVCQIESASALNVLSNWTARTGFLLGTNPVTWIDDSPSPTQRFYRAAILP